MLKAINAIFGLGIAGLALRDTEERRGQLQIGPGSRAETAFTEAIQGIVGQHEFAALPVEQRNPWTRLLASVKRHDNACVPAVLLSILEPS